MGHMILWRRHIFNQLESNYFLTFYNMQRNALNVFSRFLLAAICEQLIQVNYLLTIHLNFYTEFFLPPLPNPR